MYEEEGIYQSVHCPKLNTQSVGSDCPILQRPHAGTSAGVMFVVGSPRPSRSRQHMTPLLTVSVRSQEVCTVSCSVDKSRVHNVSYALSTLLLDAVELARNIILDW